MKLNTTLRSTVSSLLLSACLAVAGCGSNTNTTNQTTTGVGPFGSSGGGGASVVVAQSTVTGVEALARPAINEGLFTTNAFLNAVNTLLPSQQPGALTGAVLTDAATTLTALANVGGDPGRVGDEVTAFIPDVLRIDVTINSPIGTAAYTNSFVEIGGPRPATPPTSFPVAMPRAGRKLEDDVVDATFIVLTDGAAITGDRVFYKSTNPGQGHSNLNGQVTGGTNNANEFSTPPGTQGSAAVFPFLAPPQ